MEGPADSSSDESSDDLVESPPTHTAPVGDTQTPPDLPPTPGMPVPAAPPTRRRGWRNAAAVFGIVGGFFFGLILLCVPGIFALRSYLRWQRGETPSPLFAWICAGVSVPLILVFGLAIIVDANNKVLIEDDFNAGTGVFVEEGDNLVTLEYVDGAYRILVIDAKGGPQHSRNFSTDMSSTTMSIETDATVRQGPSKDEVHGVGCWATRDVGYLFEVGPDGFYAILKAGVGGGPLTTGTNSATIKGLGETNRLRLDCVGGGLEPTRLTAFVNGTKVAEASDSDGYDAFIGVDLFVNTSQGGTDVLFDNFVAREL